jgi:hypothetical protein
MGRLSNPSTVAEAVLQQGSIARLRSTPAANNTCRQPPKEAVGDFNEEKGRLSNPLQRRLREGDINRLVKLYLSGLTINAIADRMEFTARRSSTTSKGVARHDDAICARCRTPKSWRLPLGMQRGFRSRQFPPSSASTKEPLPGNFRRREFRFGLAEGGISDLLTWAITHLRYRYPALSATRGWWGTLVP